MNNYDGLEIFMMNVGNADCFLVVRYYPNGATETVLIDGGNKSNATDIAVRLTGLGISHINHVVNTHPHIDHAAGLIQLIEDDAFTYDHFWMHQAWEHIDRQDIRAKLDTYNAKRVLARFDQSLATQHELYELSTQKGVTLTEPFMGAQIGPFTVIGPTAEFYLSCLQGFGDAEKVKQWNEYLERKHSSPLLTTISEVLDEGSTALGGVTSPENESSVVLATRINGKTLMLTGDAGCNAFDSIGKGAYSKELKNLNWMQAPHHGSRRNLPEEAIAYFKPKTVFISSEGSRKHPSLKLVNAFKQTGTRVFSSHYPPDNNFIWLRYSEGNVPPRNLKPATALYEAG